MRMALTTSTQSSGIRQSAVPWSPLSRCGRPRRKPARQGRLRSTHKRPHMGCKTGANGQARSGQRQRTKSLPRPAMRRIFTRNRPQLRSILMGGTYKSPHPHVAPDGGAYSIAGLDIHVAGGTNLIAIFSQWGAISRVRYTGRLQGL